MIPGGHWPIVGQEAICPDGLGRIVSFEVRMTKNFPLTGNIVVETYINNRSCNWDAMNVSLIKLDIIE